MQSTPFKSALMMARIIAVMIAEHGTTLGLQMASQMPAYKSRGHGRGSPSSVPNYTTPWYAKLHGRTNGEQECARRVRQMSAK